MRHCVIILSALLITAAGCDSETPNYEGAEEAASQMELDKPEALEDDEAEQEEAGEAQEEGAMEFGLSTEAFEPGGTLPAEYTCDGEGVSPQLTWSQPPDGTQSYAIVMSDPDAPDGTFYHWGVWGIPGEEDVLRKNVPGDAEIRITTPDAPERDTDAYQAKNNFGEVGYGAPCPPKGDESHQYVFQIFALGNPGPTFDEVPTVAKLLETIEADALGQAKIVGTYKRAE